MEMPVALQGDLLKRLLQGAVVGVAATLIIGFGWGGPDRRLHPLPHGPRLASRIRPFYPPN